MLNDRTISFFLAFFFYPNQEKYSAAAALGKFSQVKWEKVEQLER